MVSLARKNLLEDIPRFLVAQAGIMFAVSLVTIQTGIFNGFTRSAAKLIDNSEADIWVASESMVYIDLTLPIPQAHVAQAQQVAGVERAEALIVRGSIWRHPSGEITPVRVIGFDPNGQLFIPRNITQGSLSDLKQPYSVIVDTTNLNSLNVKRINDLAEVSTLPARVVGFTERNRSTASNAFMFTSLDNANAYLTSGLTSSLSCTLPSGAKGIECTNTYAKPDPSSTPAPKQLAASDPITYVLIQAQPGQDLQALKQKIEASLPNTRAYTRTEIVEKTQYYWQKRTGIGFLLGLGAAVGVIVGAIVVSQILYSSVTDHLQEFGTLKAMGASDWVIYGVIIEQALWMAILGYLPGMVLCSGVAAWTFTTQGIIILITPLTAIAALGITVVMCVSSAIFAIQKVTRVDPAIVFKA
ncbi:MAG: ABC transporter permease [Aphanothece sp. CMT-3BRIN-NPC111]|jgi:putative ABC transport system permease protein|nr:ABC transporter permease [Aphanothece sp. CMT-3BRIN-NPC111]